MQKIVTDRLRPEGANDPHGVEQAKAQLREAYQLIEGDLGTNTWAMGEAFTLVDCAAAPALFCADTVVPFREEQTKLTAYLSALRTRPSFARVLEEAEPYFGLFPMERKPRIAHPARRQTPEEAVHGSRHPTRRTAKNGARAARIAGCTGCRGVTHAPQYRLQAQALRCSTRIECRIRLRVLRNSNDAVFSWGKQRRGAPRGRSFQPSMGCIVTRLFVSRFRARLSVLPIVAVFLAFSFAAAPVAANEKYAAIVVDANSGKTLFARNADAKRYPASLTKMMTLYVLFEELDAGRVSLNSKFSVSKNAAAQAPSKIGVRAGGTLKVEDAILALVTKSANDVAVVVAENVGGSVSSFAERMTRTARKLGMRSSNFRNPHGLPNNGQTTSARDMVVLASALQDRFPTYYKYFSTRSFSYKGARYRNHNRLLGSVEGVDGIKTGYIRASGFNLVTNVKRDGRHVIAVVMGGKTGASRDAHMRELIAEYLPKAKRGNRTTPLLIVDSGEAGIMAVAEARLPRARPVSASEPALAYAAMPKPRDIVAAAMAEPAARVGEPTSEPAAAPLAQPAPEPIAAPIAQPAPQPTATPIAQPAPLPAVAEDELAAAPAVDTVDPVAERISAATQIAERAEPGLKAAETDDPMSRLAELARLKAADNDLIAASAAAKPSSDASGPSGWVVQIGAVPSEEGAQELLDKAQDSLGEALAAVRPLTQEVEHKGETLYRARFAGFPGKDEARAACEKLKSKSFACLAVQS